MKIWSEGKKDNHGNVVIAAGWVYTHEENVNEVYDKPDEFSLRMYKATANWFIGPLREYFNKNGLKFEKMNEYFDSTKLKDLITYVEFTDLIDFSTAKTKVFPLLIKNFTDETVWEMFERLNLLDRAESSEIEKIIDDVLAKHPDKVADYKNGKVGLLSYFIGDVMKLGRGKIKPQEATEMLKNKLS